MPPPALLCLHGLFPLRPYWPTNVMWPRATSRRKVIFLCVREGRENQEWDPLAPIRLVARLCFLQKCRLSFPRD